MASRLPVEVASTDRPAWMIVGCFTTELRNARGRGLSVFHLDTSGDLPLAGTLEGIANPSYLLADPVRSTVYAAHGDGEIVSAYAFDRASGRLRSLGEGRAGGRNGVSLALDAGGHFLYVANYADGSISTLPVAADGSLGDATSTLELPGPPGPHRIEQAMSHPHHTMIDPSGRFLIVPDKGKDRIFVLEPDAATGKLTILGYASMRAGAGPRHITFHPTLPRAFVVNEIDSSVATLDWDARSGKLMPLKVFPALPPSFFAHNTAAEIVVAPSGRFLYASHRGADLLAHFSIAEDGSELGLIGWTPTGRDPRFIALSPSGNSLLVANEQSDTIVEFRIDPLTGELTRRRAAATPSPAAMVFL